MLSVEEITSNPGEQLIIGELDEAFRPLYRDDLPWHNYSHARDDVLPEVIRLDGLEPTSRTHGRFNLIAATLGHDAGHALWLPEGSLETKEERAMRLIRPTLVKLHFSELDIDEVNGLIHITQPGTTVCTPDQVKLRRGDTANVGGKRVPFLATAVNIFYEEVILADEQERERPPWKTFVPAQQDILRSLLDQDLSLGNEPVTHGMGPFNRAAMRNIGWLSKSTIRNPDRFVAVYRRFLQPMVAEGALEAITQAAT